MLRRRLGESFAGRCVQQLVAQQAVDRAMVIASQAFTALIPLLILVAALAPASRRGLVADAIVGRFNLSGESAAAVQQMFGGSTNPSTELLSVVLMVVSGVSLTRRIQRMYRQAWHREGDPGVVGLRGSLNATLGLSAMLVEIVLLGLARAVVRHLPGDWLLGAPLSLLASLVLWTSIPWLLLDRRVHWRRLLVGGLMAAFCANAYGAATTVYMPGLLESYNRRYGLFGVTLALVGWLLCISMIIVVAAIVAGELDRSPERWARRVRTAVGADRGPSVQTEEADEPSVR
ncbi:YhjD/YihY/BrkB family envelope integrity protein [Phycicoccus sp. M110.8]|uniref:YihY/virulence factor BrkB family protein n=1 Tax=Phycicoccus sp. M110.8 TaxID=3075433 RepID=UPI0028FD9789|nr:YhjD/YihY/BrkB family envelope integrity protein [Phycicoccus sp. M110.8]MDU0314164.1 YhjD/YihY/BrkB family envelope integrity protein [Phycicoccus sp. M110.8]